MTKTKDGFYKQIAGVTGDNSYVLLGGGGHFPIHSGRNNEANKIVRTDVSGYIQAGWINTTSGNMSTNFNKVYVSNDSYIRYKTKADFGAEMRDSGDMDGRWVLKDGDTMTGRLVNKLPSTRVITGNGVVGGDHGASANPRYFPSKWSFSTELSAVDGDVIIIKIPVAGHDYGVYVSIDDGANYYPVVLSGTGRLTTHYPANTCIELVFEANGSAASMFPLAGGNSRVTISNGVWRVINYYVDGNPGEWNLRQYTIKAAAAITGVHVIGGTDDGYKNVDSANMTFDIRYPVLYAGSAITSGSTGTNNFIHHYSVNIKNSSNSNVSFTSYKNIYIKGTISGTTFTPISGGNPYVQDITATDDGYVYYYIGRSYNGSAITFDGTGKDIYIYKNGAIRRWSGYSINTDNIKTVSTDRDTKHYLTFVDSDNLSGANESLYTNGELFYNPGIGAFGHGYNVTASGNYSHAEGYDLPSSTIASNKVSFVVKVLSSSEKAIVKSATGFEFDYLYVHDHPSYFFSTVNWSGAIYGDSNLSNLCGYVVYVKNYEVNSSLHGTFFMLHVNIANKFPDPITLINGNTYYWAPIMGALGNQAHKEGRYNLSLLTNTHSEGECTMALGSNSHAEGSCTHTNGLWSHAEGVYTTTFNSGSHAEGRYTIAKGNNSHAEGTLTQSNGDISHAEGYSNTASGVGAHAEGYHTATNNDYAHAEGYDTRANGEASHSEGGYTISENNYSHAEGYRSQAYADYSHSEGSFTIAGAESSHAEGYSSHAYGDYSHSEGYKSEVYAKYSHAEGSYSHAEGTESHAEGTHTKTFGVASHAEGYYSRAEGEWTHAEGSHTIAENHGSHAEGRETHANGEYSHSEGAHTYANGSRSHAEGSNTITDNSFSHAEGYYTLASGEASHAEGSHTTATSWGSHAEGNNTIADAIYAHAEGSHTEALGLWSHAEGKETHANGEYSHSEGSFTIAGAESSHAEGYSTTASGTGAHAEGYSNTASGVGAHVEGCNTTASGTYAHAEGDSTTASGTGAHAEGNSTTASGGYSHSSGVGTSASHNYETAIGKYNVSNSDTIFSVGIGTSTSNRKNGLEVTTDGKVKAYDGFYKNNSNNTYVLLGGGDHKLESNLSVASAGKWTTARSLTIGSKSQSVDGSGNVTWTLAQIGAASSSHTHNGGVAKTAWGQQYVNASGILTSISGNMSSVGNIIPSGNNAQNIGSATNRWAKLYIGTADSYGSATQGIYWNAGVPTAMTYSLNATVNSSGNNNAGTVAYYSGTNTISSATKLFYDGSLWIGETSDAAERDIGVRSVAGTLYMFAQPSSTGYRGLYTKNNGGSETFVILIDKDNNITFNGYLNGTASNADTVDGYHAYTSNEWNALKTLGNDGVIELGRYIDMHFIANDTNDYSTRIQLASNPNPANVLSLPTETGTLVTDVHPYGYVMKEYWVDYSTSNVDTYYPVIFDLSNHKKDNVRIEVIVALDSETKPAWSSHKTGGFSCCAIWEVNGSGWGTSVIRRTIYAWDWNCCDGTNGQCPMANIGQLSNSSEEYILLRGGGKYRIRTSHGVIPVAKYAKYDGWDEQFISPISYNTSSNSWPDTLNVSGYSTNPNNIDIGTKDNFGTTYGIFKYLGFSSTTLTVEIGGVKRTCTINPGIYVYNNYSSVTTIYPIGINSTGYGRWTTFYKRSEFYFTSEGAYHTSDIRKKYDIYDILNNDVNQLFETENGFIRHFKWKETSSDAYGFIAQELQEYCPEAVDLNEDNGYYSVNYNVAFSKIIGAMFKKIKELERKLQEKENH